VFFAFPLPPPSAIFVFFYSFREKIRPGEHCSIERKYYNIVYYGFRTINTEWWHYYDEDLKERVPLDISFEAIAGYEPSDKDNICEL